MDLQTRDGVRRPDTLSDRKGIPGIPAFPFPPHGRSIDGGSKWLRGGRVNSSPSFSAFLLNQSTGRAHQVGRVVPVSGAGGIPRANCGRKNRAADATVWAVVVPRSGMTSSPLSALSRLTSVPIGETGRGLWRLGTPGSHVLTGEGPLRLQTAAETGRGGGHR